MSHPRIEHGLVAAWVGVGGPRKGAGRRDAWLQVGLVTNELDVTRLYFEVNGPVTGDRYTELIPDVRVGSREQVAVVELAARPGWWQVWVGGTAASAAFPLPGSSGRWHPTATVETYVAGDAGCNAFAYRFEQVEVAAGPAGRWTDLVLGERFEDRGYRMVGATTSTFVVTSA